MRQGLVGGAATGRLNEGRLGASTGSGGLCSPVERHTRGDEEHLCCFRSATGKAGGEGWPWHQGRYKPPWRIRGGSPQLKPPPFSFAVWASPSPVVQRLPSIMEEEEIVWETRIAGELG
jgi:hypothetical protein